MTPAALALVAASGPPAAVAVVPGPDPATALAPQSGWPPQARPLAITMWDFSWLERRWPGAGYEDWDAALDGLAERGYDAVRIDAYPHLVSVPTRRASGRSSHAGTSRTGVRRPSCACRCSPP